MREMKQVQVTREDDCVVLTQPSPLGNESDIVVLTIGQVPLVVKWMQEASRGPRQEGEQSEH